MEWLHYVVDYGIIGLLVAMSIIAFSIGIERYLVFKKVRIEDYQDRKSLELYLTRKTSHYCHCRQQCTLYRTLGHCFRHHAHFLHHGQIGIYGHWQNHDQSCPGA